MKANFREGITMTGNVRANCPVQKRVTNLREHRDFEKEFEIKTTFIEEIPQTDKHYVSLLLAEVLSYFLMK